MPRPLRIEFPDACYHVICRGNAQLPIFGDDADKELLLDRMVHFAAMFRVEIRAYCVMTNHVHIHLRTREPNLGAYMRSFLTSFTSLYSHRHNFCGHVFQGRYKAFLVQDSKVYAGKVTGYIHLNPVRTIAFENEPLDSRHEAALQYPWSSYGAVMGIRPCPKWLHRGAVLKGWGGRRISEKRKNYRRYVESQLLKNIPDPMAEATARAVLGSERFVDLMRRGLDDIKENQDLRRERSQHRKLREWHSLEAVISAVSSEFNCPRRELLRRHNRNCEARQVLLFLAATCCRGRYSLAELGRRLGPISLGALGSARTKMQQRLTENPGLRKRLERIKASLDAQYAKVKKDD